MSARAFPGPVSAAGRLLSRRGGLAIACYLLAVLVWLVLGCVNFAADAAARANGSLAEESLPLSGLQLVDLAPGEDGWYTTTSGDPQIILEDVSDQVVRTLSYRAEFDAEPREMCLYYTTAAGEPYSQDKRVFPTMGEDGSYIYTLPRTTIVSLRLDPCSPDANTPVTVQFEGDAITLNAADALPSGLAYWLPSWYQLFCFVLYPALAAAIVSWLWALWREIRARRKG